MCNGSPATHALTESRTVVTSVQDSRTGNRVGIAILCMLASMLLFSVFNATAKWLVVEYSPMQILFFRALFGFVPIILVFACDGNGRESLVSRRIDLQIVRAVVALGSNTCFVLAYRFMPLADAVSIAYASPIFVTLLSMPLLSERVGIHRCSAALIGFFGVLLVAQPGVGIIDPAALLALAGTVLYALTILLTRKLGQIDRTVCTMVYSTTLYLLICGMALPFVWVAPDWPGLGLLVLVGLVSGTAMFLFMHAYRHSEAAIIAPFDYTAIAWAVIFGFVLWGEIPGMITALGILVITLSGLYITNREMRSA